MKRISVLVLTIIVTVGIAACSKNSTVEMNRSSNVGFLHIHGLGYSSDGKRLLIPVHNGLIIYVDGQWREGPGDKHDYMGFTTTDNGFYSSGHPAPGSTLKNPLGLIKSTNDGKSITVLAHTGEIDLHGMAAGYRTHTLYVLNPEPNSKMKQTGLYYSKDEGQTWTGSLTTGLRGQITAIAAHPTETSVVIVGTTEGTFMSKDNGQTFTPLLPDRVVSATTFMDSDDVLVAVSRPEAAIYKINIQNNENVAIKMPSKDVISFIAQNPMSPQELAVATEQKDIFVSTDSGITWKGIANKGTKSS